MYTTLLCTRPKHLIQCGMTAVFCSFRVPEKLSCSASSEAGKLIFSTAWQQTRKATLSLLSFTSSSFDEGWNNFISHVTTALLMIIKCIYFSQGKWNFGIESFRATDCTGTDNQTQGNETARTTETKKLVANKTNYRLNQYAIYDLRPGNRAGPILTVPEPIRIQEQCASSNCYVTNLSIAIIINL